MREDISSLLCGLLSGVVDIYPVFADVEKSESLPRPFAVYRVKAGGERTKEGVKGRYEVGIFIVCDDYDQAVRLEGEIDRTIDVIRSHYLVSTPEYEIKFDGEDRNYVCEMSFTIKKL